MNLIWLEAHAFPLKVYELITFSLTLVIMWGAGAFSYQSFWSIQVHLNANGPSTYCSGAHRESGAHWSRPSNSNGCKHLLKTPKCHRHWHQQWRMNRETDTLQVDLKVQQWTYSDGNNDIRGVAFVFLPLWEVFKVTKQTVRSKWSVTQKEPMWFIRDVIPCVYVLCNMSESWLSFRQERHEKLLLFLWWELRLRGGSWIATVWTSALSEKINN